MVTRLAILGVAAVVVVLVAYNRKLHSRLVQERELTKAARQDAAIEQRHKLDRAAQETARLARRNHELEQALATAQGMQTGLRTAAQDAHVAAHDRIADYERELAEMRLAATVLWRIQTKETWSAVDEAQLMIEAAKAELPPAKAEKRTNGAKRPTGQPARKALTNR